MSNMFYKKTQKFLLKQSSNPLILNPEIIIINISYVSFNPLSIQTFPP